MFIANIRTVVVVIPDLEQSSHISAALKVQKFWDASTDEDLSAVNMPIQFVPSSSKI